jgi:hypothetical protein
MIYYYAKRFLPGGTTAGNREIEMILAIKISPAKGG